MVGVHMIDRDSDRMGRSVYSLPRPLTLDDSRCLASGSRFAAATLGYLLCVPAVGASASGNLGERRGLVSVSVRSPGRETRLREPPLLTIQDLVRDAIRGTSTLSLPFVIFGDCAGALLAFELARLLRMRADGPSPLALLVRGCEPPQHFSPRKISHLPIDQVMKLLRPDMREQIDRELLALMEPTLRADLRAIESYVYSPGKPLDVPIGVVNGPDEPDDLYPAWADLTTQQFCRLEVDPLYCPEQLLSVALRFFDL